MLNNSSLDNLKVQLQQEHQPQVLKEENLLLKGLPLVNRFNSRKETQNYLLTAQLIVYWEMPLK
jgi:hypothetical protein